MYNALWWRSLTVDDGYLQSEATTMPFDREREAPHPGPAPQHLNRRLPVAGGVPVPDPADPAPLAEALHARTLAEAREQEEEMLQKEYDNGHEEGDPCYPSPKE